MEKPDFVIIGAGAIGGFVGILLHDAGFRVRFLLRDSESARAQQKVLSKTGFTALSSVDANFRKSISPQEVPDVFTTDSKCLTECSHVFVATKRLQNEGVHRQLVGAGITCPVVFLQNGLRVCENLSPKSYESIESVVDFNTFYDMPAGVITLHQSMDSACLVLDGNQPSAQSIARHLSGTVLSAKAEKEFIGVQSGKLIINMTNAVNALSGKSILSMLMQAPYRHVLAASMEEAKQAFAANGIQPTAKNPADEATLRDFVTLLRAPQSVFESGMPEKLKGRGEGYTSMAQDLRAGRAQTEVDFLNGEIVRLGQMSKMPTPVNQKIVELVKKAEATSGAWQGMSGEELQKQTGV